MFFLKSEIIKKKSQLPKLIENYALPQCFESKQNDFNENPASYFI